MIKDFFLSIVGEYVPYESTYGLAVAVGDGLGDTLETWNAIAAGVAALDVPWIFGALAFIIVLWSFFRVVGVLLSGR